MSLCFVLLLLSPKKKSPHIPGLLAVVQLVSAAGQFGRYCKSTFRRTFHSTPSSGFSSPSSSLFQSPANSSPPRVSQHHQNQAETQGSESAEDKNTKKPSANLPGEISTVEASLWEQLRSRQSSLCFFNRAKRDLEVSFFFPVCFNPLDEPTKVTTNGEILSHINEG